MKEAWFLVNTSSDPSQLPEHGWRKVALPHQWSLDKEALIEQNEENLSEAGSGSAEPEIAWYRLDFPESTGRRWAEICADYYCEAWVGGVYKGRHEGYFEPWLLEVPPEETLLLRVSAPKEEFGRVWPRFKRQIKGILGQHDCRPGASTARGQERGSGGLWGGVRYFKSGAIALLHTSWRAIKIDSGWKLWLELEVDADARLWTDPSYRNAEEQEPPDVYVCTEPVSLSLTPDNFHGDFYTTERSLCLQPGRHIYSLVWDLPELRRWDVWDQGYPHLYVLKVQVSEQTEETMVGFRTISKQDDWVVLNGSPLFLRGTNIIPTHWLAGYSTEDAQRDARLLKEANLNAVRVHAHLTHPFFYEACDQMGILVWQDFPLQWGYATDEEFAQEALRQAQAMVKFYGNHVSIYLWCAHNEPTHNRRTLDPVLASALRQADSTRLVKEASDFKEHPYPGWYYGNLRDYLAVPGVPIPSEFGAQALPDLEILKRTLGEDAWPPKWETWVYHNFQPDQTFRVAELEMGSGLEAFVENSQRYQARLLKFAIESFRRSKGKVTGYFQFMFVEPWEGITWAVLDVDRTPKQGFFALKEASSPVLLSIVPLRENLELGQLPISEAWVINDLPRPLDVQVKLRLEGANQLQLVEICCHIEAHNAKCIFQLGDYYQAYTDLDRIDEIANALRALPEGKYDLIGEIWEDETMLSQNRMSLTYLRPIVSMG